MLRDTPALRGKVADAKSRDAGNTIEHKRFAGGHLSFGIATSPSSLAMRPIRYLFLDEISRNEYRQSKEGDAVRLAEKRTATFRWNRKIVYASSPSNEGDCRISDVFEHSDQRQWHVPCPFCEHEQVLEWSGITWGETEWTDFEGDKIHGTIPPVAPMYRCANCDNLIAENEKPAMNDKGRYIPSNPNGLYPGFRINALVSPVVAWGGLVQEWLEIKNKPEQLKAFVNTVLAETWKEKGEAPDWERLYGRREQIQTGVVPMRAVFLTAGVDVQADRIECSLYGWGRNRECFLTEHTVLMGRTTEEQVWRDLTTWKNRTWAHEGGANMQIARLAIDTGHNTHRVYEWVRTQGADVIGIDGRANVGGAIVGLPTSVDVDVRGRKVSRGVKIWPIDVTKLKSELYGCLNLERPQDTEQFPAGWIHLPDTVADPEFCKQLCAEQTVTRYIKGYKKTEWQKIRERNEALDCWVYARAAAHQIGFDRVDEQNWLNLEASLGIKPEKKPETEVAPTPAVAVQPAVPVPPMPTPRPQQRSGGSGGGGWLGNRGGGWMNRW